MTILVSDSFNRADNSTNLGNTDSMYGGSLGSKPWTFSGQNGNYGIINNTFYASAVATVGHNAMLVDVGISDYWIQVTYAVVGAGESGKIVLRASNSENMLLLANDTTDNSLILYEYAGGADSSDGTRWYKVGSRALQSGDVVKAHISGTSVQVFLNGTSLGTYDITGWSTPTNTTKCGLMSYHYPNTRLDDFVVADADFTITHTDLSPSSQVALSSIVKSRTNSSNAIINTSILSTTVKSNSRQTSTIIMTAQGQMHSTTKSISLTNSNAKLTIALSGTSKSNSVASVSSTVTGTGHNGLPYVNKTVIVMMENRALSSIVGNSDAPYLTSLANNYSNFTDYHSLTHPSQPSYFMSFSGSDQGITDDNYYGQQFNTPNLYTVLNAVGKKVVGYSEGLPSDGYTGSDSGRYADRHNPWKSFKNVPASSNLKFSDFPTDYSQLPDVSFVVPNLDDDMHDGTILQGDTWVKNNFDSYLQWANENNSLLIIWYDEDEDTGGPNIIPFIMAGPMVKKNFNNPTYYDHYSFFRTMIDLYGGTTYPANGATANTINDTWNVATQTALSSIVKSSSASSAILNDSTQRSLIANVKSTSSAYATLTTNNQGSVSSSVKSRSSISAFLTITKRLTATNNSITITTGTITNKKPLSGINKSDSNSNASLTKLIGAMFATSIVKSKSASFNTGAASVTILLQAINKSKTNALSTINIFGTTFAVSEVYLIGSLNSTSSNKNIRMGSGEHKYLNFAIGDMSDLSEFTLEFTLKTNQNSTFSVIDKQSPEITSDGNTVTVPLMKADTQKLKGVYYYKLTIADQNGEFDYLADGTISIY